MLMSWANCTLDTEDWLEFDLLESYVVLDNVHEHNVVYAANADGWLGTGKWCSYLRNKTSYCALVK